MCNKTTETIRQQLWCEIITSSADNLTFEKSLIQADRAVAEFDKRFNDKLGCQSGSRYESYIYKVLDKRYDETIKRIDNSDSFYSKSALKDLYFGENDFYDVSRVADVSQNLVHYAGKSKDGEDILVICKRNDK